MRSTIALTLDEIYRSSKDHIVYTVSQSSISFTACFFFVTALHSLCPFLLFFIGEILSVKKNNDQCEQL